MVLTRSELRFLSSDALGPTIRLGRSQNAGEGTVKRHPLPARKKAYYRISGHFIVR